MPAPQRTITAIGAGRGRAPRAHGRFSSHFGCRVPSEVAQTVSVAFAVA